MIELKSCKQVDSRLIVELSKNGKDVIAVLGPQTVGLQFITNTAASSELVKVLVAAINEVETPVEKVDEEPVIVADPLSHSPVIEKVHAEAVATKRSKAVSK